ncbi:MAG TPA: hypothetical protein VNG31_09925 [Candidatus Baltobacteraceae bacterium]|nr:hypothetical protein [Candidatus Baltobacteraceae bacterium]
MERIPQALNILGHQQIFGAAACVHDLSIGNAGLCSAVKRFTTSIALSRSIVRNDEFVAVRPNTALAHDLACSLGSAKHAIFGHTALLLERRNDDAAVAWWLSASSDGELEVDEETSVLDVVNVERTSRPVNALHGFAELSVRAAKALEDLAHVLGREAERCRIVGGADRDGKRRLVGREPSNLV